MKRAALSAASASIAPPRCAGSLAITPTGRPSIRASAVTIADAEAAPQLEHRAGVGERVDHARGRRRRAGGSRGRASRSSRWSAHVPVARARPGSRRGSACATATASASSADERRRPRRSRDLHVDRADLLGREHAEAAALDHRRAAHADGRVLGGDDRRRSSRAARRCRRSSGPTTMPTSGTRPLSRAKLAEGRARRGRRQLGLVGVARPAAAALGEQDDRQPQRARRARASGRSCWWLRTPCVPASTV